MKPGRQESSRGAPENTKQPSLRQLTSHNTVSQLQSQIWTDLRHFISIWSHGEARKTLYSEARRLLFTWDSILAPCINLISHTQVWGADECEEKKEDAAAAVIRHTDESPAPASWLEEAFSSCLHEDSLYFDVKDWLLCPSRKNHLGLQWSSIT